MIERARENAFASCPAATGEAACADFPDRAHRCSLARGHEDKHVCTDGSAWTCFIELARTNLSVPAVVFIPDRSDDGAFARSFKVALEDIHRKGHRR
jgi:hypothetical protein